MKVAAVLVALGALTTAVPAAAQRGASSPDARAALQSFGACVADNSAARAAEMLAMDFTTHSYRQRMKLLVDNNNGCFGRRYRWMRSSPLLLAGAVAEQLIERGGTPLKARLAQAAARPATAHYSPSDRGAICVVRSAPDDVAALFATEPASDAETKAAAPLGQLLSRCMPDQPVESTVVGLRAILATAAFRSIHAGEQPGTSN